MNDKRDAYLAKLKARLDVWNTELDQLEAKASEAGADTRIKYQEQVGNIRQQRDEAKSKLDEIKNASGDAWEHLKQGADDTWKRLEEASTKAKSDLKS